MNAVKKGDEKERERDKHPGRAWLWEVQRPWGRGKTGSEMVMNITGLEHSDPRREMCKMKSKSRQGPYNTVSKATVTSFLLILNVINVCRARQKSNISQFLFWNRWGCSVQPQNLFRIRICYGVTVAPHYTSSVLRSRLQEQLYLGHNFSGCKGKTAMVPHMTSFIAPSQKWHTSPLLTFQPPEQACGNV